MDLIGLHDGAHNGLEANRSNRSLSVKTPPAVSVVIGRVSTEDGDRIIETLQSLAASDCEIVIADRIRDSTSERIRSEYPQVTLVRCDPMTSLPEMRTLAYERTTGEIVAVTEDHCVPCPGWIEIVQGAFARDSEGELVAVGGCVTNGVTARGYDWATFLSEYSFFVPPVAEGECAILPGMNIAYRRSALQKIPRDLLLKGFWETTVHQTLLDDGGRFLSLNRMRMDHRKHFSVGLSSIQRFLYSQYYSGIRFQDDPWWKRIVGALACLALPPVLFARAFKSAREKGLASEFARATPGLLLLMVVWALGESYGALAGPGQALEKIE